MSNSPFPRPLELEIDEQALRFSSPADLAFSLEGRTAVSSAKLSDLFKLSTDQLEAQGKAIANVKQSLLSMLTRVAEEPDSIDGLLRELDPLIFSQDRSWRHIVRALNAGDAALNPVRTTALTKYVKYLYSLEDAIADICADRKRSVGAPVDDNEDATWVPDQPHGEPGSGSQASMELTRLPRDIEVSVRLLPGQQLDVHLASYACRLLAKDEDVQFIEHNKATILSKGLNIVGRGTKSTVMVDVPQRDVSRSHLQIFISDNHTLQLTDLSSAGTFITTDFLI